MTKKNKRAVTALEKQILGPLLRLRKRTIDAQKGYATQITVYVKAKEFAYATEYSLRSEELQDILVDIDDEIGYVQFDMDEMAKTTPIVTKKSKK